MVGLINELRYWFRDIRYKRHQKLLTLKIELVDLWSLDYNWSFHDELKAYLGDEKWSPLLARGARAIEDYIGNLAQ